jgi:hypothetical protein
MKSAGFYIHVADMKDAPPKQREAPPTKRPKTDASSSSAPPPDEPLADDVGDAAGAARSMSPPGASAASLSSASQQQPASVPNLLANFNPDGYEYLRVGTASITTRIERTLTDEVWTWFEAKSSRWRELFCKNVMEYITMTPFYKTMPITGPVEEAVEAQVYELMCVENGRFDSNELKAAQRDLNDESRCAIARHPHTCSMQCPVAVSVSDC